MSQRFRTKICAAVVLLFAIPSQCWSQDVFQALGTIIQMTGGIQRQGERRRGYDRDRDRDFEEQYLRNEEELRELRQEKARLMRERSNREISRYEETGRESRANRDSRESRESRPQDPPTPPQAAKADARKGAETKFDLVAPAALVQPSPKEVVSDEKQSTLDEWLMMDSVRKARSGDPKDVVVFSRSGSMPTNQADAVTACFLSPIESPGEREFIEEVESSMSGKIGRALNVGPCAVNWESAPVIIGSAAELSMPNFKYLKPIMEDVKAGKASIIEVVDYRKWVALREEKKTSAAKRCHTEEISGPLFIQLCNFHLAVVHGKEAEKKLFAEAARAEIERSGCPVEFIDPLEKKATDAATSIAASEKFSALSEYKSAAEFSCRRQMKNQLAPMGGQP